MKLRNILLATASMALTVSVAGAVLAQNNVAPATGGAASHGSADAWDLFTGKSAPEEHKWRFKKWRNEITLRSLEMYSEYEPGAFIERIAPTIAELSGKVSL